jgi:hypothetical protein
MYSFNGLGLGLGNLSRLSHAKTRSISPENFTGEKGKGGMATEGTGKDRAGDLGQGWKISPSIHILANTTVTLGEIEGPGVIQHIWMTTHPKNWRNLILRVYWDGEEEPSIQTPYGDFFCCGWNERCNVQSLPVAVNPAGGFNSYWEMPFRKSARMTLENIGDDMAVLYYQVDYALTTIPDDAAYFHAHWRRSNPLAYKEVHTIVDHIKGHGHYVGTYLAWGVNNNGWWGEGEIKFFLDGDGEFPTICGTGTEDYICGAWNFEQPQGEYCAFNAPFSGLPQVIKPNGLYRSQMRFGMYRWHIMDPIRFESDLVVSIQALGWRNRTEAGLRYLPLQDDIASVAFWYQTEPHVPHPPMPGRDFLEII